MTLSLIAAVAEDRVIGLENALPWRLPADLKRFKGLTMGHHLLMGRRTWESIGRSLPGRTTVVISRRDLHLPDGIRLAGSLEEAIEIARRAGDTEAFVAGGEEVFRQALPLVERIYLTRIRARLPGDTFFPEWNQADWTVIRQEEHSSDDENPYPYSFLIYERAVASHPPDGKAGDSS